MFDTFGSPLAVHMDALRGRNFGGGKTFFVSNQPQGSDDNEGTDPQFPLARISVAIAKCTARRNDYVFVQYSYEDGVFPLNLNVRTLHLIGLGGGNMAPSSCLLNGDGEAAIQLGADSGGVEIAGFNIGGGDSDPGILLTASCWNVHIHHNAFGMQVHATDGIYYPVPIDFIFGSIDHNYFETLLSGYGLNFGAPTRSTFNHNVFRIALPGVGGIRIIGGNPGTIIGNVFYVKKDGDEGCAINLGTTSYGCMVMDNIAGDTGEEPGNCPYLDNSAPDAQKLNAWAKNYSGNQLVYPQPHA